MTKTHYIAMSGSYGCLPDYLAVLPTVKAAAQSLGCIHELSERKIKALARDRYIDLSEGADYAEISECDCSSPRDHDPELTDEDCAELIGEDE